MALPLLHPRPDLLPPGPLPLRAPGEGPAPGQGLFLGALSDALSLFPFGLTALTYLIVSFVLLQITDNFIIRKRRDQFLLTLLALVAKSLLDLFFLRFFEFSLSPPTLSYLILRPLFTSVTFFLVLFFLSPQGHNDAESRQP